MSATRQPSTAAPGHDAPAAPVVEPLQPVEGGRTRTAAEQARTLVASASIGSLATLSSGGDPWASVVAYGTMPDGAPVLLVSTLAEHGRNLHRDPRASLSIAERSPTADPLDSGRVTLAGRALRPDGDLAQQALATHVAAVPGATAYASFGDFTVWILRVERARWVGGFGRMDSTGPDDYRAAESDPTAAGAAHAVAHLNADHADALLAMAQALAGHPDATSATCARIDRYGLDLAIDTPRGSATARVAFAQPAGRPGDLRAATVDLAQRARSRARPAG